MRLTRLDNWESLHESTRYFLAIISIMKIGNSLLCTQIPSKTVSSGVDVPQSRQIKRGVATEILNLLQDHPII